MALSILVAVLHTFIPDLDHALAFLHHSLALALCELGQVYVWGRERGGNYYFIDCLHLIKYICYQHIRTHTQFFYHYLYKHISFRSCCACILRRMVRTFSRSSFLRHIARTCICICLMCFHRKNVSILLLLLSSFEVE
jgi:hypothetical protein